MVYKINSIAKSIFKSKSILLLFFFSLLLFSQSCSTYRVVSSNAPSSVKPKTKTMWTFAWGLVQARDFKVCIGKNESGAVDQIKVKNNLGYVLLSAATAGIVMPIQVECYCAKVKVVGGTTGTD